MNIVGLSTTWIRSIVKHFKKYGKSHRSIQNVCDLYGISNKALNQAGLAGLFLHTILRKATVSCTGLNTMINIKLVTISPEGLITRHDISIPKVKVTCRFLSCYRP